MKSFQLKWCCLENDESANYRLVEVLTPGRTFLCTDVSANLVILKALDEDCLHRDQLHPAIRDRLAAIRELAHPHVAALRTVEQWNGQTCMVWIYVPGQTWDHADVEGLSQKLTQAVTRLHELGIVHGNLHGGNIIVQQDGAVWLTDVSPYLYADAQADLNAIDGLVPNKIEADPSPTSLLPQNIFRLGPLVAAGVCVLFTVIIFVTVRWFVSMPHAASPASFPSLRH